jgi:hypothetical protein
MLQNGKDVMFSLPLKRDSDSLDVCERTLSDDFNGDKLLNQLRGAYASAPRFAEAFPMVERAVRYEDRNLFRFVHHALVCTCQTLGLKTPIRVSSSIEIDHSLKSQDKVIALSQAVGATTYVNAIGGVELYDRTVFRERGLDLTFIRSKPFEYRQFGETFVPWLSLIDVLMFNPIDAVRENVSNNYEML